MAVAYLGFHMGAKFLLATSDTARGNYVSLFLTMAKKCPSPKYATVYNLCYLTYLLLRSCPAKIVTIVTSVWTAVIWALFEFSGWHLATQILYFIGAFLVLFCEIFARLQMCCRPRSSVYRSLGFILLSSCEWI